MTPKDLKKTSKFLSLVLRHRPEVAGLTLDPQGWVKVMDLLEGCQRAGKVIDRDALAATYLGALDTLRILRGGNPDEAEDSDHTFRRWVRVQATPEGPNNIPIWFREGHKDMTHADLIGLLKKLREEVLG